VDRSAFRVVPGKSVQVQAAASMDPAGFQAAGVEAPDAGRHFEVAPEGPARDSGR
jgi:hypothetical protein